MSVKRLQSTTICYHSCHFRLYLATLRFNENAERTQAKTAAGELRYQIKFPKAKRGGHVVSIVKTEYTTGQLILNCLIEVHLHTSICPNTFALRPQIYYTHIWLVDENKKKLINIYLTCFYSSLFDGYFHSLTRDYFIHKLFSNLAQGLMLLLVAI